MSQHPLNVGLVGGGKGAFIVHPHQKAIHFDGTRRVVAGALFPDPKIALEEAANWPYPLKGYGSYDEMIAANATLPEEDKLDYIVIVTPNHVHFDPAMKALKGQFSPQEPSNLKRTFRRASFLVSRLLANLGAAGGTPILERFGTPVADAKSEKRWREGLYLDEPEEWDDPYRFFRW